MIIGNIYSLFRDQELFDDDVDEFRPERFLNSDGSINKDRENFIYNNIFGWGRRSCPGAGQFSLLTRK
jgi:cytochrome P450